jgi:flagellar biosynthesis/type III secretory pathway M-ring protein FliF/YscJ
MIEVAIVGAVLALIILIIWFGHAPARKRKREAEAEAERRRQEKLARKKALLEQIERETPAWVIERRKRAAEKTKRPPKP